jgi:hypothetical protein
MGRRTPADRETEELANEALRLLFYHAETGLILRRCYWYGKNVGEQVGTIRISSSGMIYSTVSLKHHIFMAHRVAFLLHYGRWPAMQIDHRDGNGLNNRIENLQEATSQQNAMNQKLYSVNSSGVSGVSWHKLNKKWYASISVSKKRFYLGSFDSFEDAVRVRKEAELKHGFSERHGTKETAMGSSKTSDRIPGQDEA